MFKVTTMEQIVFQSMFLEQGPIMGEIEKHLNKKNVLL
jgi:hypothetical protein